MENFRKDGNCFSLYLWFSIFKELEPEEFSCFKNKVVIMRADAKKYEEELKKEVIHWTQLDRTKVVKTI